MKNNDSTTTNFQPDQKNTNQQDTNKNQSHNKHDQFKQPGQAEKGSDKSHTQTDKSAPKRGF